MKIKVKNVSDSLVELSIKLLWKNIKEDYFSEQNKLVSDAEKKANQGYNYKGPQKQLFLKKFLTNNQDFIKTTFVDTALNRYYQEALKQNNYIPINQGKVLNLEFDGENTDFNFSIQFEVKPDIGTKIPSYQKKINIATNLYIATNADVDKSLEDLRAQHAQMKSVERNLKSGDFLHGDFTKLDENNKAVKGGMLPNHHIRIGEGLFVGDLEKPFLNKKIGRCSSDYG